MHVYCISGFGADERVFSKLEIYNVEVHFIQWLIPLKKETLQNYAGRMAEQIHHDEPILIGLSFGGMMAIEIAKQIPLKAVVIISSIKSFLEMPSWMRIAGATGIYQILPLRSFKVIEPLENYNLGLETEEEKALVSSYRQNVHPDYTRWAIHIILTWRNSWRPQNIYHIHGKKDRIFPIRRVKADIIIPGGGHMMILNRSAEISLEIQKILKQLDR